MNINFINREELKKLKGKEGLILISKTPYSFYSDCCGKGNLKRYVKDITNHINYLFGRNKIFMDDTKFENISFFIKTEEDNSIFINLNILFYFDNVHINVEKFNIWRAINQVKYPNVILSKYVISELGGFD